MYEFSENIYIYSNYLQEKLYDWKVVKNSEIFAAREIINRKMNKKEFLNYSILIQLL